MPNGGDKTWESKGTKHVLMLGLEDKRKITMPMVSFSATRDLLPPHIVFVGIAFITLPQNNQAKINCIKDGWGLIFSENHLSSLEITK
jgi:hypothetical protein